MTVLRVYTETIKNSKHQVKTNRLHYTTVRELFSSFWNRGKNELHMFVVGCTII